MDFHNLPLEVEQQVDTEEDDSSMDHLHLHHHDDEEDQITLASKQQEGFDQIPPPVHNLQSMMNNAHQVIALSKRFAEDVLSPGNFGELAPTQDRKRRKTTGDQQLKKRQKYDVLKAFFRVYFKIDEKSAVLKDAIYNLYTRKISVDVQIARNAMYRHMWTFFKPSKISASQSNYREYVKGIKLLSNQNHLTYEGVEKDIEILRSCGADELFDFEEEELAKSSSTTLTNEDLLENDELITFIDDLMETAQNLALGLKELRNKLKKNNPDLPS